MATVFLSGAGGTGGVASIKILQKTTDHDIIAADANAKSAGFYFADHFEVVPRADSQNWPTVMSEVIREYGVDVYIPLIDEELLRLTELESECPDWVEFAAPSEDFIRMATDKWEMTQSFIEHGFAVPDTFLGSDANSISADKFPLLIKPRQGRGSKGIKLVDSTEEVMEYFTNNEYQPNDVILQEFIDGIEFTTSVVGTKQGDLLGVVPKEVISRPDGNTSHGVTRDAEQIIEECGNIFNTFNPEGPFNIQHMRVDGSIYAFEINPRFSSTACLTVEAGMNELDLIIRNCLGESIPESVEFEAAVHMFRYTDQIYDSNNELFTNGNQ